MTEDPISEMRRAARIVAFSAPDGSGFTEMAVEPGALYTVLPRGAVLRMPRSATWWLEPHSHQYRGCTVVVHIVARCPICRARAAGIRV